ncbi:hypothetical protein D3C86_2110380 [compost metagenome]
MNKAATGELPFVLPLPPFVPAFQQLHDQVFLLFFREVSWEKAVDSFSLNTHFFFLIRLFLR